MLSVGLTSLDDVIYTILERMTTIILYIISSIYIIIIIIVIIIVVQFFYNYSATSHRGA